MINVNLLYTCELRDVRKLRLASSGKQKWNAMYVFVVVLNWSTSLLSLRSSVFLLRS